jgi:hypothetical protein
MRAGTGERRVFRPSVAYITAEALLLILLVVPWAWGSWLWLAAAGGLAAAIAFTRAYHSVVVTPTEVVGPSPTLARRRNRIPRQDVLRKPSDWSWYPYEIGSKSGDQRIAVWTLSKADRVTLFNLLSLEAPT